MVWDGNSVGSESLLTSYPVLRDALVAIQHCCAAVGDRELCACPQPACMSTELELNERMFSVLLGPNQLKEVSSSVAGKASTLEIFFSFHS